MARNVYLDWTDLKTQILSQSGVLLNFRETEDGYQLTVLDRDISYITTLAESSDITDFETNYKADANQFVLQEVNVNNIEDGDVSVTLDEDNAELAKENTLTEVRDSLGQISGTHITSELQDLNGKDFATQTTLFAVLSQLDITLSALRDAIKGSSNKDLTTLENDIESILAKLDVNLSSRASDSNLLAVLSSIGEQSGTNVLSELQFILSQLDVALSSRASESTLTEVRDNLDTVEIKLQTIIDSLGEISGTNVTNELQTLNSDVSKDSTSQEIRNTIGQVSGATVLSRLLDIYNKLIELFQSGASLIKIWDGTSTVDVVTESGEPNRLAVDIKDQNISVSSDDSPTNYQLKSDYNASGATVLSTLTDTELFSFTGTGIIDLIAVTAPTSSNWEIAIEIDGTERLRISMDDLGTELGLVDSNYPLAVTTANKQFRYFPKEIGFKSTFRVLAKATSATPTVNHLILYREHNP